MTVTLAICTLPPRSASFLCETSTARRIERP